MELMSLNRERLKLAVLPLVLMMLTSCCFERASEDLYIGTIPGKDRMVELNEMGIKSIIAVRTNSMPKRERWAREAGLKYYHIPTGVFKIPREQEIEKFTAIMKDGRNTPAYLCCVLGDDRTAVYMGMYRVVFEGWSAEKAYQEVKDRGLPEPWPIFHSYIKTLQLAEKYRVSDLSASEEQTR